MEYMEMIFQHVPWGEVGRLVREELRPRPVQVLSSRFYDPKTGKELEYEDADWDACISHRGTGHIFLKALDVGMTLERALILVSRDGKWGEVTVHVEQTQFSRRKRGKLRELLLRLEEIRRRRDAGRVLLGYEPAEDRDMTILELAEGELILFEENRFLAPEAALLRRVGEELFGRQPMM